MGLGRRKTVSCAQPASAGFLRNRPVVYGRGTRRYRCPIGAQVFNHSSQHRSHPAPTGKEGKQMIPLLRPQMGEEEVQAIREVIYSGWIGMGPKVEEFEAAFAR